MHPHHTSRAALLLDAQITPRGAAGPPALAPPAPGPWGTVASTAERVRSRVALVCLSARGHGLRRPKPTGSSCPLVDHGHAPRRGIPRDVL
ncbi:unnamed protein product, partial [Urochloa humidicola]